MTHLFINNEFQLSGRRRQEVIICKGMFTKYYYPLSVYFISSISSFHKLSLIFDHVNFEDALVVR